MKPTVDSLKRRWYDAMRAGGRTLDEEGWTRAVHDAAQRVDEKWREQRTFSADAAPLLASKPRARFVPGEYVAMPAELVLSVEAELAHALTEREALKADNRELRERFLAGYHASLAVNEQYLWELEQMGHRTAGRDGEALVAVIAEVRGYRKAAKL